MVSKYYLRGPRSSVGIATDYGLEGPGSNWKCRTLIETRFVDTVSI